MRGHRLLGGLWLVLVPWAFSQVPTPKPPSGPAATAPGLITLTGDDAKWAEALNSATKAALKADRWDEAIARQEELAALHARAQGPTHFETVNEQWSLRALRRVAAMPMEDRSAFISVDSLSQQADSLMEQGKYRAAQPLLQRTLDIRRKVLGEDHPHTATSYDNLAQSLYEQGQYGAAQPLLQRALDIRRKVLGEDHPHTATSYNNLAANLDEQGQYGAAQPLYQRALDIRRKVLGEDHPDTPSSYNDLAYNLNAQGQYGAAQPLFQKALDIRRKVLGEDHPHTATSYNNLACNLNAQGQYGAAQPLLQRALDIRRKVLGEDHPDTASSCNNLAYNLNAQGQYVAALPLHQRALDIRRKVLGEDHPDTASFYNNLAYNLNAQGQYGAAQPLFQKALDIRRKVLGEDHPHTATSYNNLAANLDIQGRLQEAIAHWKAAATGFERSRRALSSSGLERAQAARIDPLSALAVALARQNQGREAWRYWESSLARGLLDDLSARRLRPLTLDQHHREADLLGQLQRLDEQISKLAAKPRRSQEDDRRLEQLRRQESSLRGQFLEFEQALEAQYGAFAGKPATLEQIQAALPAGAALLGWIDYSVFKGKLSHHWACLVRFQGDPIWVPIPGTGPDGAWTQRDDQQAQEVLTALINNRPDWRAGAESLARRRLEPLKPHLNGIRQLIVLPSADLAGLPIEALVSAWSGASPLVVSYAPSGTMFARLLQPRSDDSGPPRLLALGDPAYREPEPETAPPKPPDRGILIRAVLPYGPANLAGIQSGDVLLEYNGTVVRSAAELKAISAEAGPKRIPVKLWRNGEVRTVEVSAGRLGINLETQKTAAEVILAQREADAILKPLTRGQDQDWLPGTRREVQSIAALFPQAQATTLLGSQATESAVQRLAGSGELAKYRFLHFAAHGQTNPAVALSSAIILAPDPDRSADPTAASETDGQITAQQIVNTWDLDADLVVLSACQSGLGKYTGGEGYLGFAQALFVKGARSLVLSLWKVDDRATALLMTRFYQNLLGQRPGLVKPLPRVEALAEAKDWLRGLTGAEVRNLAPDEPTEDQARSKGAKRLLVPQGVPAVPAGLATDRPFAHPYYWAAFILVGDPD